MDPVTSTVGIPLLAWEDLRFYQWLQTPAWVIDVDHWHHVWFNPSALQFWETDAEEFLKREHSSASEVAKARMRRIVARNLAGEVVHDQWTLPIRPGETVSVNLVFRGVLLPDRRQAALVLAEPKSVEQDVAAKRGVEALRQTPVRIAIHPLEGGAPLMRNPASIEAFGGDERYGPALTELFDDPTLFEQLIAKVRTEGHATSEAQLRTQSGLAWHSVDLRKMRDAVTAMPVVQFNARDIDDLKTAQAELVQARLAAEAATRARTEFLAHVSHEIRTPLNGLIGLAQVLSRSPLQDNDRRHVDMMVDIGRSLLRVVGDVLDLSKVEAGKLSLQPIPMRVRIATAHSLAPLQVQAAMQMLLLEWHVDDDVPDTLVTDPLRWGQILLNLAGNALKFTEQGSVQVRVKYQDEGHFKGLLSCTVKDTGVGMTPAQLARAFEPYAQVNEHATSRGTGLGLPIVMRLLDLMGGTLDAHSAPGDGSTFTFHVPANRPGPAAFDGADELLL